MDTQGRLLLELAGLALGEFEVDRSLISSEAALRDAGVMHMEYIQFMIGAYLPQ